MAAVIWPVGDSYKITSEYGLRTAPTAGASTDHKGVDISVPTGTAVSAAISGNVTKVGYNSASGNWIEITGNNGLTTRYRHLSSALVSEGQTVKQGQTVARSGNTGNSTGPHLHFETLLNGQYIDPQQALKLDLNSSAGDLSGSSAAGILTQGVEWVNDNWLIAAGIVLAFGLFSKLSKRA